MIGSSLSHYRILSEIGRGGMGVVYRALDDRLGREVALKVLPAHQLATDQERSRFFREAHSAAQLNHSGIATIYEIDEDDAQLFIVMELVEGQDLASNIADGPLATDEACSIGVQIAEALVAAHAKGIVHRDVKPGNVMITPEGHVKLLDFGLAKELGGIDLTRSHETVGTTPYMSPEQLRGEAVDARSDIWALGVVLYEMLTGERPFGGRYAQAVMYAICNQDPPSASALRPEVAPGIDAAIARSLSKSAGERHATMADFAEDLRRPASIAQMAPRRDRSIVVLPFDNLSAYPDQEYFSDGLTDEIITDLSVIRDLLVISRNTSMMFKATTKSIEQIAQEVGVRYVLEGSVRKAGNNLRIAARLTDASTGIHIWADKYRGTLEDVFDIQETVSRAIVDALAVKLSPDESDRLTERKIDDVHAYECYLKAREEYLKVTEEGLERALVLLQNGLDIIGENEVLHAGLATVYLQYIHFAISRDEGYVAKAEESIERVFRINPDSAQGHFLRGFAAWWRGNHVEAVAAVKKSVEIDPRNSDALGWLGWMYGIFGQGDAARPLLRKAIRADPMNPISYGYLSGLYLLEGRADRALKTWAPRHKMNPQLPWFRIYFAFLHIYNRDEKKALEYIDLLARDTPDDVWAQLGQFLKHACEGDSPRALASVTDELEDAMRWNEYYPLLMADCYAMIDERESAIDWLEEAVKWGCSDYLFLTQHDPFLERVRGERRFQELAQRVKTKWEQFEV